MPQADLARGTLFAGRYEIIEELGTGGMGRVFRVHDAKLNEEIALKLIKPEIAAERRVVERFRSEIKIARKIRHENVCGMYDLHEEGQTLYLTMEYVRGEDLKSLLHRMKTLPVGTALAISRKIAEGLGEAHKLGIIHRDLKPGNIMIDKEGNAKIMDFGIARTLAVAGTTAEGAIIGTPEYMSPEQVEGRGADRRSDIYSLGIVLFEMLTGKTPFEGETPLAVAHKQKYEPAPDPHKLNPQIPGALSRIILRSLEKAREKRYQTTEEFLADLAAFETMLPKGERIVAKPRMATSRTITVRFQPRKFVIPAFILVIIVAASLFFLRPLLRKEIPVAPKIENSIAVISFENLTGSPAYNDLIKAVPSLFITKLETMGFSYVATWERLQDLLKQMGKDPFGPIYADTGFAACRREGIRAMVVGRITKAENVFAVDIKVLDVETKRALASASSRGEGEGSILLAQVDDLSAQISQRLGPDVQKTGAVLPISDVTTSSLEAYGNYLKGQEAFDKFYFEEACRYFLRAVEMDPAFALAYRYLARTYANLRLPENSKEAAQKAMSLADRTTPKEKLLIESTYVLIVEGDLGLEKNIQINRQLVGKFPKEKEARYSLGNALLRVYERGRAYEDRKDQDILDEAIRELQAALDLDPNDTKILDPLIHASTLKNDLGMALEYAKRQVATAPGEPNPLDTLGSTYIQMGLLDPAIESFKKALSIRPDFFSSLQAISLAYALKEDYPDAIRWANEYAERSSVAGYKAEGLQLKTFYECWTGSFQKALEDAEKYGVLAQETQDPLSSAVYFGLKGAVYRFQKKYSLSQDAYMRSYDIFIQNLPRFVYLNEPAKEIVLGSMEIEAGNINAARKRLVTVNRFLEANNNPVEKEAIENFIRILQGKLLLAEGSFADAISVLEELRTVPGFNPGTIYEDNLEGAFQREEDLARAYEMKGDVDKAIDVLEHRARFGASTDDFRLIPPKVYYDLGCLYDKKGLKEKAGQNYAKFLDLWKDADPGQPEVEDARKRLAELKDGS